MKIIVKAKTKAKRTEVERVGQPTLLLDTSNSERNTEMVTYKVSVKEAPVGGKANEAIVRALSEYFGVAVSSVRLLVGQRTKHKVFEVIKEN